MEYAVSTVEPIQSRPSTSGMKTWCKSMLFGLLWCSYSEGPKWPEVPSALCLELDIKGKVIWNSAATIADEDEVIERRIPPRTRKDAGIQGREPNCDFAFQ